MAVFDKIVGIGVASGFKLQAAAPLDGRLVVDTEAELNELIEGNGAYQGMVVYAKDQSALYVLDDVEGQTWSKLGTVNADGIVDSAKKLSPGAPINISGAVTGKGTGNFTGASTYTITTTAVDASKLTGAGTLPSTVLPSNIQSLPSTVSDLEEQVTTVEGTANKNKTDIATANGKISANEKAIQGLQTSVNGIHNVGSIVTDEGTVDIDSKDKPITINGAKGVSVSAEEATITITGPTIPAAKNNYATIFANATDVSPANASDKLTFKATGAATITGTKAAGANVITINVPEPEEVTISSITDGTTALPMNVAAPVKFVGATGITVKTATDGRTVTITGTADKNNFATVVAGTVDVSPASTADKLTFTGASGSIISVTGTKAANNNKVTIGLTPVNITDDKEEAGKVGLTTTGDIKFVGHGIDIVADAAEGKTVTFTANIPTVPKAFKTVKCGAASITADTTETLTFAGTGVQISGSTINITDTNTTYEVFKAAKDGLVPQPSVANTDATNSDSVMLLGSNGKWIPELEAAVVTSWFEE